jgi:hypothetical protein
VAQGYTLSPERLDNTNPDSILVGQRFVHGTTVIIFRVDPSQPHTVFLGYYGQVGVPQSLYGGLYSLLWFCRFAAQLGYHELRGAFDHEGTFSENFGGLPADVRVLQQERVLRFYQRMGVAFSHDVWGKLWMHFDLRGFRGLQSRWQKPC